MNVLRPAVSPNWKACSSIMSAHDLGLHTVYLFSRTRLSRSVLYSLSVQLWIEYVLMFFSLCISCGVLWFALPPQPSLYYCFNENWSITQIFSCMKEKNTREYILSLSIPCHCVLSAKCRIRRPQAKFEHKWRGKIKLKSALWKAYAIDLKFDKLMDSMGFQLTSHDYCHILIRQRSDPTRSDLIGEKLLPKNGGSYRVEWKNAFF